MALVQVALLSEIPDGTSRRVLVKRQPIAIFNVGGLFFAIDDTCSHADASLADGQILPGSKVACPLHGAQFDLRTGDALTMPAVTPVETYHVTVDGTAIFLEV